MFEFSIKKNEKDGKVFENKSPNFKAMDLNEEVVVKATQVLKEGTASNGSRSWTWKLFKFEINGEECAGFAPNSIITQHLEEHLGEEVIIVKEVYKDNKDNDKIGFNIKKEAQASSFEFKTDDLKDEEGVYTDKDAIQVAKNEDKFNDLATYISMWKKYGSTEERAKLVFQHRKEI